MGTSARGSANRRGFFFLSALILFLAVAPGCKSLDISLELRPLDSRMDTLEAEVQVLKAIVLPPNPAEMISTNNAPVLGSPEITRTNTTRNLPLEMLPNYPGPR